MNTKTDAFNKNSFGHSATAFIRQRVNKIVMAGTSDSCKEGASGFVKRQIAETIFICESMVQQSFLWSMLVFVHEARHLDWNDFGHVPCQVGPLKGEFACDSNYEQRGSYGIHTEFAVRLSRTEKVAKELREEARAEALNSFIERFNTMPLGLEPGVYAQTKDKRLYFVNAKSAVLIASNVPQGLLTVRSSPYWFDPNQGSISAIDPNGNAMSPRGAFSTDYINKLTSSQRHDIQDITYLDILNKQDLNCGINPQNWRMNLASHFPENFVHLQSRLGIRMRNGDVYLLPRTLKEFRGKAIHNLEKIENPRQHINYQWVSDFAYALDQNGTMTRVRNFNSPGTPSPLRQDLIVEKIVGPSFWSPLLRGI